MGAAQHIQNHAKELGERGVVLSLRTKHLGLLTVGRSKPRRTEALKGGPRLGKKMLVVGKAETQKNMGKHKSLQKMLVGNHNPWKEMVVAKEEML